MAFDSSTEVDSKFDLRKAIRVFKEDRMWPFYMIVGFGIGVPLYSVSNFLPQIIGRFGFDTVKTNLYTVAPDVVGSVFLVIIAHSSDYFKDRVVHLGCCAGLTCIGFVALASVDVTKHVSLGYFFCFLLCAGGFITSPLLFTWISNNTPDENQRAIIIPVLVALTNAMGLVSSNIFYPSSAPQYIPASIISACFGAVAMVVVLGVGFFMRFDNNRRNREQGVNLTAADVPTSELKGGQKDPRWRWMGGVQF